jgi:hypothetical protein
LLTDPLVAEWKLKTKDKWLVEGGRQDEHGTDGKPEGKRRRECSREDSTQSTRWPSCGNGYYINRIGFIWLKIRSGGVLV